MIERAVWRAFKSGAGVSMSMLVAVKGWSPSGWIAALRQMAPGRPLQLYPDVPEPEKVEYALVWKPEAGFLKTLPNLRVIFSLGAGVDHLTTDPELPDLPVVRIVDPDLTMRMTEWVVLEVLRHHRQSAAYAASAARRAWEPRRQWSAAEIRVGIMGLGELGADSARGLRALGFPVSGWSRSPKVIEGVACYSGSDGLDAFLSTTDILVVLLPLTHETRGLIDRGLIDRLSRSGPLGAPVLINAGRGGLQVERDIDQALRDGRLAGASLDVFASEPLPADSPLWTAPNLVITPHVAAESDPLALSVNVLKQISAFERGEPLQNLVDRARGY